MISLSPLQLVFMEHAGWRLLVAGCVDGNVRFYDTTNNGAQVFELQSLNQDAVSALACDGSNVLVLGTASGVMRVYDMRSLRIGPTRVQRGAFARTTIYAHDERILGYIPPPCSCFGLLFRFSVEECFLCPLTHD